jgi:hypothetical protein
LNIECVIWDEDDDPDGNVAHIAEHDITPDEVEDVLYDRTSRTTQSSHAGRLLTCGWTSTDRFICVSWERALDDPLTARPVTAFLSNPPRDKRRGKR